MSKSVTTDQSHAIMASLATNVSWDQLDGDLLQKQVVKNPKKAGRCFTQFLIKGARIVDSDLKIATAPFDPVNFISEGWKDVAEDRDEKSAALKEVDITRVRFVFCLRDGETSIKGEEKLHRLKENGDIRLGATLFMGLWKDYQLDKENSVLERAYQVGIIRDYIDFFGNILLDPHSRRHVLYLYRRSDGPWDWSVYWLRNGWNVKHLSAVFP